MKERTHTLGDASFDGTGTLLDNISTLLDCISTLRDTTNDSLRRVDTHSLLDRFAACTGCSRGSGCGRIDVLVLATLFGILCVYLDDSVDNLMFVVETVEIIVDVIVVAVVVEAVVVGGLRQDVSVAIDVFCVYDLVVFVDVVAVAVVQVVAVALRHVVAIVFCPLIAFVCFVNPLKRCAFVEV